MRKLASIRTINQVRPIPEADLIEAVRVDGWWFVAKKGEFKVGDMGVYFEIDSFLPGSDPRFSFLANKFITFRDVQGARIRTMTMKGQLSQGLMMPLSVFPEIVNPHDGDNVTELLGITKWEPQIPAELSGSVKGGLPYGIPVTDEERIQNLHNDIPTKIAGKTFEKSVKLDGSSMTVYRYSPENDEGVAGRNWNFRPTVENTLWSVANRKRLHKALAHLNLDVALRGEIMGPGIQENNEKLHRHDFFLFNIWDIKEHRPYTPDERNETLKRINDFLKESAIADEVEFEPLQITPSGGFVTFADDVTVEDILAMADGPSLNAPKREGIVFKQKDGPFSFKAISDWYLKKHANR